MYARHHGRGRRRAGGRAPGCGATPRSGIALRAETDLRQRLFAHLQRLHFAFHDEAQTGQLMARANTDIQQIRPWSSCIPLTAASTLTMIGGRS